MAAQHAARYSDRDSRRHLPSLPSIKELNFSYRPPDAPVQNHPTVDPVPQERLSQQWARTPARVQQPHPQQQHTPPLSAGHEMSPKVMEYTQKHDSAGYLTPGIPLSAQMAPIPGTVTTGTRTEDLQAHQKRRAPGSTSVNVNREARPIHNYPGYHPYTPQPPPSPFHQLPPSPHDQMNHQAHQSPISAHPGYPAYSQHYQQQRPPTHGPPTHASPAHAAPAHAAPAHTASAHAAPTHTAPTHTAPAHTAPAHTAPAHAAPTHVPPPMSHQHHHVGNPYPSPAPPAPPTPQNHWEHHQQPPPPPPSQPESHLRMPHPVQALHHHSVAPPPPPPPPSQETYMQQQTIQPHQIEPVPYSRTSSLVPPPVDTRAHYIMEPPQLSPRASTMSEIVKLCSLLYSFAMRYAQADTQPNPTELAEMAQKANEVVRLLEDLRRMYSPDVQDSAKTDNLNAGTPDDHRPPKRPWEEMSKNGLDGTQETHEQNNPGPDNKSQSTAEQDMEIIRTKRATTTTGGSSSAGQPKSKYRKRSRATPPGKCHSCNIRETPEWRRGPDGARTLCNACGLHYAKLMRKRMQLNGPGAPAPQIDMETLRASARAVDLEKLSSKSALKTQSDETPSPMDTSVVNSNSLPAPIPQQQHHQSAFQVTGMTGEPSPQQISPSSASTGPTPQSPWSSNAVMNGRGYQPSDPVQHQSFMRTSQASPR